ncbi:hypothetical protein YDYSY3_57680 [Paenibacillus chitinolyticus]|uniref:hypothetical protein n=1 Tax=Paenibacillus chitinolyticus TaxID=79263 RepID=UPI0026E4CAE6|nr:hypothetical protein [Paenibacillus chitinolyticus]GKS14768.1 hypothetical protein YDYSY3_57680 [Paenibacillus chitinolyticus]
MDKIPTERIGEALARAAACNAKANITLDSMRAHIRATEGAAAETKEQCKKVLENLESELEDLKGLYQRMEDRHRSDDKTIAYQSKELDRLRAALREICEHSAYSRTGCRDIYSYEEAFKQVREEASAALLYESPYEKA